MPRLELIDRPDAGSAPTEGRQETLATRARDGDVQAWARLYSESYDSLFRHIRYLTGDPGAAEELAQETYARAFAHITRFRGDARFSTWLHGIAINVVRMHWRQTKRRGAARERLREATRVAAETVEQPDRAVLRRQQTAALYAALERLPDNLREVFVLRDLEEVDAAEAAAQLGISLNNLHVRATRARQRLRRELEALADGEDS